MRVCKKLICVFSVFAICAFMTAFFVGTEKSVSAETSQSLTSNEMVAATAEKVAEGQNSVTRGGLYDYSVILTKHVVTRTTVAEGFSETEFDYGDKTPILKINNWTKPESLVGAPYGPHFNPNTPLIRFNWEENISFKITANANLTLTVKHEALSGILETDNVIKIRTYKRSADGTLERLWEKPLYDGINSEKDADFFGGTFALKAGESFYFEYGCTGAYEKNITSRRAILPNFAAVASGESFTTLEAILAVADNNGGKILKKSMNYGLYYGSLDNMLPFDNITEGTLQTLKKNGGGQYAAVYANATSNNFVRTNGTEDSFIIKIDAVENIAVTVTNRDFETASGWISYYAPYQMTEENGRTYFKALSPLISVEKSQGTKDVLGATFHIPAGDSLVYVIYGANYSTNIFLLPEFSCSTELFDDELAVSFFSEVSYELDGGTNAAENASRYLSGTKVIFGEPTKTDSVFVGWDIGGTLYSADHEFILNGDINLKAVFLELRPIGAGIRLTEDFGLRFCAEVNADDLAALTKYVPEVMLGTLVIPSDMIGNAPLTKNTEAVLDIRQTQWYEQGVVMNQFNAVLQGYSLSDPPTETEKERITRYITARPYAALEVDGEMRYFYTETLERSIFDIACAAVDDHSDIADEKYVYHVTIGEENVFSPYTQAQIDLLSRIIGAVGLYRTEGIGDQAYLYGMCYNISERNYASDYDLEREVRLMANLGVKSIRLWMHVDDMLLNPETVDGEKAEELHRLIAETEKYGMRVIGMNHTSFHEGNNRSGKPSRNIAAGSEYIKWLEDYYLSWKTLAKEFSEIDYWEIGNELNNPDFMKGINGEPRTSVEEMADISTDMLYYASRGIRESNPSAVTIMGGLTEPNGLGTGTNKQFLQYIYDNIASGDYGYFYGKEEAAHASLDADDYFLAAAWHPYYAKKKFDAEEFVRLNGDIYDVILKNEGKHKKVFFTEMGFNDTHFADDINAASLTELFAAIEESMPYVESVNYFKLFNVASETWTGDVSRYGLFYDPDPNRKDVSADGNTVFTPGAPKEKAYAFQRASGGSGRLDIMATDGVGSNQIETNIDKVVREGELTFGWQEENDAIRPSSYISDNMVLQRRKAIKLSGTTNGRQIAAVFNGETYYGTVTEGVFTIWLPPLEASEGDELIFYTDIGKKTLKNIAVGEVFLCSGQSNMAWTMNYSSSVYQDFIAAADYPRIRLFNIPKTESETELSEYEGVSWQTAAPSSVGNFSAVGFLFGLEMQKVLNVPIGLVSAAVGSSLLCYWLPQAAYETLAAADAVYTNDTSSVFMPSLGYNGMIAPLTDMVLRGIVWYQGESNGWKCDLYKGELTALINSYRTAFSDDLLTFTVAELPRYNEDTALRYATIRDAQYKVSVEMENVALAVNIDDGDAGDLHPRNKNSVAKRLAEITLDKFFDIGMREYPVAISAERISAKKAVVTVSGTAGYLFLKNGANGFEVSVDGTVFSNVGVKVCVSGKKLIITAEEDFNVVRYGVSSNYDGETDVSKFVSVYNGDGVPLRQFEFML